MGTLKKIETVVMQYESNSAEIVEEDYGKSFTITTRFCTPVFLAEFKFLQQSTPNLSGFLDRERKYKITIEEILE